MSSNKKLKSLLTIFLAISVSSSIFIFVMLHNNLTHIIDWCAALFGFIFFGALIADKFNVMMLIGAFAGPFIASNTFPYSIIIVGIFFIVYGLVIAISIHNLDFKDDVDVQNVSLYVIATQILLMIGFLYMLDVNGTVWIVGILLYQAIMIGFFHKVQLFFMRDSVAI